MIQDLSGGNADVVKTGKELEMESEEVTELLQSHDKKLE